jgi:hypothetical protein
MPLALQAAQLIMRAKMEEIFKSRNDLSEKVASELLNEVLIQAVDKNHAHAPQAINAMFHDRHMIMHPAKQHDGDIVFVIDEIGKWLDFARGVIARRQSLMKTLQRFTTSRRVHRAVRYGK